MWVTAMDLPKSPGHPFYQRLNRVLDEAGFDRFVEKRCEGFYAGQVGRPSLVPGRYFRLMLVGYFEGFRWAHAGVEKVVGLHTPVGGARAPH